MSQAGELAGAIVDGKYRLERLLGRGGMGAVYLATHLGTERPVALKLIAPEHADRPDFLERFRREARAAGRLRHPNVVDVTDFGITSHGGRAGAYLVMEYLDGCSLADVLGEEGPLPLAWTVDVLEQACAAVEEAHRHGVIHRDLKPENLWLEPDRRGGYRVKVLDFGLARLAGAGGEGAPTLAEAGRARDEDAAQGVRLTPPPSGPTAPDTPAGAGEVLVEEQETRVRPAAPAAGAAAGAEAPAGLTRAGDLLGTPLYMSPEQCRGGSPDARSDVYGLGVIAYRMLAGRPPFAGSGAELLRQHLTAPPRPLDEMRPGLPPRVAEVVAAALAKSADERPHSAAAFGAALRAAAAGRGSLLAETAALVSRHARPFLRIAALTHLPLAGIALAAVVVGLWTATGSAAPAWGDAAAEALLWAWVLTAVVALSANSAVAEPTVAHLLVAPLRPVELGALVRTLRGRLRLYARTVTPYFAASFVCAALAALPAPDATPWRVARVVVLLLAAGYLVLRADAYLFVAQVVMMEGLSGREAIERSATLSRGRVPWSASPQRPSRWPGWKPLVAFAVAAALASALAALLVGGLAPAGAFGALRLGLPGVLALLLPLLTCLSLAVAPFVGVALALLYFRARMAQGETLEQVLARFEGVSSATVPRQEHLRERIHTEIRGSA